MKRVLLLIILIYCISICCFSQEAIAYFKDDRELSFIPIGQAGNAYGFRGNPRTYLWADPRIDAVVFTHRMLHDYGTTGVDRIAYDVSIERGLNGTWINNLQVYEALIIPPYYLIPARYPQGGIYNPHGNTNPDSAYYTYFVPTLDQSNEVWGGYGYGVNRLTETNPTNYTQHNEKTSGDNIWRYIPNTFTITQDGFSWVVDMNYSIMDDRYYLGYLIINKGTFNTDSGDYEYEEWLFPALSEEDSIIDIKVAFSPDGQTGYICILSDSESDRIPYTCFHPILYITEDGGDTWSEEPIHCQLGGPEGLYEVKYFVPDEFFIIPPMPDRDSLYYGMGYHCDMVVDKFGNAHITGMITLSNRDCSWCHEYECMGTFHLIYNLQNQEWEGHHLYYNRTFDGDLGGMTQYNRPQISSDIEGKFQFISWIDTDLEGVEENTSPDIYCVAYDHVDETYTEVYNITAFTQAMWTAYFGSQSHYVFTEYLGNDADMRFTIPFVYEECNPYDPYDPVQFWYIDGFHIDIVNYWCNTEKNSGKISNVKQNHPNPFDSKTTITIELEAKTNLSLEITNLTGQVVYSKDIGLAKAGSHDIKLYGSDFESGLYFYTVIAGDEQVTKKMVVK